LQTFAGDGWRRAADRLAGHGIELAVFDPIPDLSVDFGEI
jgi:hypothetical protein